MPVPGRLRSLPWVTIVLVCLLVVATTDTFRPERFAGSSTLVAGSAGTAERAAVFLSHPDLTRRVEDQLELGPAWRQGITISVERPADHRLVVRAEASDPRLAALAADTAGAMAVQQGDDLTWNGPSPVPSRPLGVAPQGLWWGGGAALILALLVERRRDRALLAGDAR